MHGTKRKGTQGCAGNANGTPQRASLIIAKSVSVTPMTMMNHATATATLCAAPSSARSGTFSPNENACTRQSRGLHTWRSTAVGPLQGFTTQYEAGCDVHRACRAWAGRWCTMPHNDKTTSPIVRTVSTCTGFNNRCAKPTLAFGPTLPLPLTTSSLDSEYGASFTWTTSCTMSTTYQEQSTTASNTRHRKEGRFLQIGSRGLRNIRA